MSALRARISRRLAASVAAGAGYEIRRSRLSPLVRLANAGIVVETVLDVGAALGDWSRECAETYPNARYLLVEPLDEFSGVLARVVGSLPRAEHIHAAAAAVDGETTFNVHVDLVGSSLYREAEGTGVDGVPRTVRTTSLDTIVHDARADGPYLIKVDVQGAELEALAGGADVLAETQAVILEVSFIEFFDRGTLAHEVIAVMNERGFVIYDLLDLLDRPLDGTLAQANIVFVPRESPARREKGFATVEQRAAQNIESLSAVRRRL